MTTFEGFVSEMTGNIITAVTQSASGESCTMGASTWAIRSERQGGELTGKVVFVAGLSAVLLRVKTALEARGYHVEYQPNRLRLIVGKT